MRHKLILTIIVVVITITSPSFGHGRGYVNFDRLFQTGPYSNRCRSIGWGCSGSYSRSYGRSSSAISGGYLALNALQTVAEIQQQNRVLSIVESQFAPQPQRVVVYQQSVTGPVLNRSNEEIRARFKEQEAEKARVEEVKRLQAEIERLKLELEKIKLEKELEQAKKTK